MEERLARGIELRELGEYQASYELLRQLAKDMPENPQVHYQCAWSYDVAGFEKEAVPFYEAAIRLPGLSSTELENAYLGLGSTYRTIGAYEQSKELLLQAIAEFPTNQVYPVFLAMTYYNLNQHQAAMELLLTTISQNAVDADLKDYQSAIGYYADKLDRIW